MVTTECGSGNCGGYDAVSVLINTSTVPTTTTLGSSLNPSNFEQSVTFTATVTPQTSGTPTGTVTFTYGSTTLCNAVTLSGGAATCAYSYLPLGSDIITAAYSGDSQFAPSSGAINQTVNKAATATTVTSSPNPSTFNQQVTFTATVTGQFGGTPSGTVTFSDGTTTLGTSPLSGGTATFSTGSLTSGLHSINAVYSGDSNFLGSSASLNQTVNQASTTVMLTSSVNPSGFGLPVTFSAPAITPQYGGQTTGTVTFKDGSTTLGSTSFSGNAAAHQHPCRGHALDHCCVWRRLELHGQHVICVSQVVQGPAVTLSPTNLTLPTQVVFTTSPAQKVTLTNTGLGILEIVGGGLSGQLAQPRPAGRLLRPRSKLHDQCYVQA